jgi:hypothetical protein
MGARPALDNDQVSELIGGSVAAVVIDVDRARVPMMIVSCDVLFIFVMTATVTVRSPTGQHERADCQGGRY